MPDPLLRPFRPSDLDALQNRDGEQGATKAMAHEQATGGPAFTAVVGDRVIGCAGIVLPWSGIGMAWMAIEPDLGERGLWLTRTVRRVLDDTQRACCLHRIEAVALADFEVNQRWLESLGFHVERDGRARQYLSGGQDVIRYERVE